jgi:hypothetical protein
MEHLSSSDVGTFRTVCVSTGSFHVLKANLDLMGFALYSFDSKPVHDSPTFLRELARCFGILDPGAKKIRSWDGASDLIWQELMARPEKRAAILIRDAHVLVGRRMQVLLDALDVLFALADSVEKQKVTAGTHPVLLRIVLIGDGPSFPDWS